MREAAFAIAEARRSYLQRTAAARPSVTKRGAVLSLNTIIYVVGLIVVIGFVLNLLGVY